MLKAMRRRFKDMRTISQLSVGAEKIAHESGDDKPGAEHFMLAAFDLSDGSAKRVFEHFDVDRDTLVSAIDTQYEQGLRHIGIEPDQLSTDATAVEPVRHRRLSYQAQPSVTTLFKQLYAEHQTLRSAPLSGALVVAAVAKLEHGVTSRMFRDMGICREQLGVLAEAEAASAR